MTRVLVTGGAGFIGHHLVKRLKHDGHHVAVIDRKFAPEFEPSPADEYVTKDLRFLSPGDPLISGYDEVYQLAAEVGGLGYIMDHANDAEMLRNSMQINLNVLECCRMNKIPKVFFASSACVYRSIPFKTEWVPGQEYNFLTGDTATGVTLRQTVDPNEGCQEWSAYPADPDNEYAWEKLFAERLYAAYASCFGLQVRIARFHNCFGPLGTYTGGREKAPAALCRKVAEAEGGTSIEIWGDGEQTRSFMYVDDAVEGAIRLMASVFQGPVNIGSSRLISINHLAQMIATIGGKMLELRHTDGPVGVRGRNSDNTLIKEKLGWEPVYPLELGLVHTYRFIYDQVTRQKNKILVDGKQIAV